MTLVRRIARPLLAGSFVLSGIEQLRQAPKHAQAAAPLVSTIAPKTNLPDNPELLVRVNGGVMVGAGLLLATGKFPRSAALVLATSMLPTAYIQGQFWAAKTPEQRSQAVQKLATNLGLLGGALLAGVDTEGKPGLAWRGKRAASDAKRAAELAGKDAKAMARTAKREAKIAALKAKNS